VRSRARPGHAISFSVGQRVGEGGKAKLGRAEGGGRAPAQCKPPRRSRGCWGRTGNKAPSWGRLWDSCVARSPRVRSKRAMAVRVMADRGKPGRGPWKAGGGVRSGDAWAGGHLALLEKAAAGRHGGRQPGSPLTRSEGMGLTWRPKETLITGVQDIVGLALGGEMDKSLRGSGDHNTWCRLLHDRRFTAA